MKKTYTINDKLTGGFEFYEQCLCEDFKETPTLFASSKPSYALKDEIKNFPISSLDTFSKGEYSEFLQRIDKILLGE
ncbi:MAG: hypothetical protein Q9M36_14730 [Sulfurovum sp.]|nr:hypothetical protein [Sulfurovum sp.]